MSEGLASVQERIEKISLAPVQFNFWEKGFASPETDIMLLIDYSGKV